jgi:hypothetical protein
LNLEPLFQVASLVRSHEKLTNREWGISSIGRQSAGPIPP